MKSVWVAVIFLVMFGPMNGRAQTYPKLPFTDDWYHLQGKDDGEYTVFRRYSLIPEDKEIPIRNTILFHCSAKEAGPSYITLVIPKEIPLSKIYGTEYVAEKTFTLFTMPKNGTAEKHSVTGEVKGNEIFFDFLGENKAAVSSLVEAKKIFIFLNGEESPIEFVVPEADFRLSLEEKKVEFGEFVRTMIDRSGAFTRNLGTEELYRTCVDLKKWRDKSGPKTSSE